jgi:hypothetical protein
MSLPAETNSADVLDRIGETAIRRNALVANGKRLATSHCDEPSIV